MQVVKPFNRIVLFLLRKVSSDKIKFSELVFKYSILPQLSKNEKEICLILLSHLKYVIWINRNLKKYENKNITAYGLVTQFLIKIKFRILVEKAKLTQESFVDRWCKFDLFCKLDSSKKIVFLDKLDIGFYYKPKY